MNRAQAGKLEEAALGFLILLAAGERPEMINDDLCPEHKKKLFYLAYKLNQN